MDFKPGDKVVTNFGPRGYSKSTLATWNKRCAIVVRVVNQMAEIKLLENINTFYRKGDIARFFITDLKRIYSSYEDGF